MSERLIYDKTSLLHVLNGISLQGSVCDWNFRFAVSDLVVPHPAGRYCWIVYAEFIRPDTNSGVIGAGRGRDEIIWQGATETAVVKTAWVLVEMVVKHELMEAFKYQGVRIFNPHNTVARLSQAAEG